MSARSSSAGLARLHDGMAAHVARGELPGLVTLVARRGEVHVDALGTTAFGGAEPMRRDTIFRIASMTKPITAVAALILVEEGRAGLDEPVDRFLPELATPRVLRRIDGPIDDTLPAARAITLRDLLTFRLGTGMVLAPPGAYPIQKAMAEAGFAVGPNPPPFSPDEYMRRLGELPLVHQPGERWMYHVGSEVLGVWIARASGQPLEAFLRERIFAPLGMRDTGFHVPAEKLARLPCCYVRKPETQALELYDGAPESRFARPPAFPSGGGGLVSTADDYLAFCRMLLGGGEHAGARILSRASVAEMTTDQLSAEQKADARPFFGDTRGWGFGLSVLTRPDGLAAKPGRFGWDGGYGTSGYSDPNEDLVAILLTQRLMESPEPPRVFTDFWAAAYGALA